ncbi:MAG: endonuclease/exonuclease/phosphatase family protein [bacterium]|jgi:endonuclease/exonuclease/phosphatase family metal-dependent hydrolase|nr:endonuclease/exonuclease/phosphatase family protein [bacterium]
MRRTISFIIWITLLSLLGWGLLWLFPPTRPAGATEFTLVSWNVHGLNSESGENTTDLILDGLLALDADLVCLQEFPVARAGAPVRQRLRAMGYEHEALFSYDHSRTRSYGQGMALYSRHPIRGHGEWPLLPHGEGRILGLALVEVEGRPLHVGLVHMPNSDIHLNGKRAMMGSEMMGENLRTLQCEDLLARVDSLRSQALVLAGDFNTFPLSAAWRLLRGRYLDAFPFTRWSQGTFQVREGLDVKIDHIFHSRKVRSLEARVPQLAGSDHRPVFARLQF